MIEIYRSSRIEKLAELLEDQLGKYAPRSVLTPQRLIVGHLGMKRWLTQWLASPRKAARTRVAANLEMLLPSEWLDVLAQRELGQHSIAIRPYRRSALRWRIHALLASIDHPEIAGYLAGEDAPRRRFQLADRLAGLYGQYLVYRCDWLAAWERGQDAGVAHWQSTLWRRLVEDIGQDHRGRHMSALNARLPTLAPDPETPALFVFGVSHLPPDALTALDALSGSRTVQLYFPDPCRELWDDLRSQRALYAASLRGEAYLEIGHPLLAALGRVGQHFTLLLNGLDAGCDLRHQDDESAHGLLPARHSLLERLQHSILTRQPEWVQRPQAKDPADTSDANDDASLRVHVCHTRLRELEVLKDALLDQLARAEQPGKAELHPHEIVIMAPNMALYAPLVPVVFGAAADARALLPWQMADVALARTHPLLAALRELIDLPTQRITRSQVLSLLALPAIERRFGIDEDRREALARWLDRAHVAWGIDAAMKEDFGAAPVDAHSFAFGCDRMFAGVLLGELPDDALLDGRILPARPVTGPASACLGALWGLLEVLREWRTGVGRTRSLAAWSRQLRDWLERLFLIDPGDEGEREAFAAAGKLIARLAEEEADSGISVEVEWSVVRDLLRQGLDSIPERQPFLAGGITFCGMVPQRSIPFQVIALLGLNDGDYPRARVDNGLDLMLSHPRLGDRDNRSDDRYLFLEALMSARRALHLSYLGEGVQDGKPRNPALPLAELMGFLKREYDPGPVCARPGPAWLVRHPLQPFDARYFDPAGSDPRLYSYSQAFARFEADHAATDWRFLTGTCAPPPAAGKAGGPVELRSLAAFFRDPSKWICRQALKLSRDALDEAAPSDLEPLAAAPQVFDDVRADLVRQALREGRERLPESAPASFRLSGKYASGALGERSWLQVRDEAQAYLDLARELPVFAGKPPAASAQMIDLAIGERLVGSVASLYSVGEETWLVSISTRKTSFRQLLPLFIDWAALCLSRPEGLCRLAMIRKNDQGAAVRDPPLSFATRPESLRSGLAALLALYRDARRTAGVYFARTSYRYAAALLEKPDDPDAALAAARATWLGQDYNGGHGGERDHAPMYNRMLADEERFLEAGTPEHARFATLATSLLGIIGGAALPGEAG